jgi:hypothetical protein
MGLLDRMRRILGSGEQSGSVLGSDIETGVSRLLGGSIDLEVVGESHYQDALWRLCGDIRGARVRKAIIATLVPEPDNPYDSSAIAVQIAGQNVGHLPAQTAAQYHSGLTALMDRLGGYICLSGVIVGGNRGHLGVWLEHDPRDFGVTGSGETRPEASIPPLAELGGSMRTGFSEAWITDKEDDSYDLSWFHELPDADMPAIAKLRDLLSSDPDPIDRHFQFSELESRLYRYRDLNGGMLDEFDEVCRRHDAEIEDIRNAFLTKWGRIPLLNIYRQMAIRQQKKKDWAACVWWAERGIAIYGNDAARSDDVEDLIKRRDRARSKLDAEVTHAKNSSVPRSQNEAAPSAVAIALSLDSDGPQAGIELLSCSNCGDSFERPRTRGRKPKLCRACR